MPKTPESTPLFGKRIVQWYEAHGRDLPWRDTFDPYHIWIAEVVLQQTRIEQGVGYYYRFVERFPDVATLAAASQDEVLKYWEGLGYYSRARNLHAGAQQIMEEFEGKFPDDYKQWLKVKGVGPYTARAIGSFAFGNATGVIDGNVLRVMSRVLADERPIDDPKTRKAFQAEIDTWVASVDSRPFNHGIMDIGATICTPTKPGCLLCPLVDICQGYARGMTQLLPKKRPKKARPVRHFHFYFIENGQQEILIRRRPEKGLWG
ncbi:MAG: A/G-specific adenine glycosylase, partial [Bacteroidota bacterium]